MSGAEAAEALGATGAISAIGYVFNEEWANEHKEAMLGFVKASRQAKELLATSDEEWDRLRPLMQIDDDAVFKNTVKRYREGIPNRPIAEEEADTAKVYDAAREARRRGARRQGDDHVARNVLVGAEGRLVSLAAKQQPRHQSEVTAPYSVRIDAEDLSAGDRAARSPSSATSPSSSRRRPLPA